MLENEFYKFLLEDESIKSKDKAVRSRISKARSVENMLDENLDFIVSDDNRMLKALLKINENMNNKNGAYSNALRKYYLFKNEKEFPRLSRFKNI